MGFLGPEQYLISDLGVQQDPRKNIATPAGNYRTSIPKVYAAGGMELLRILIHNWNKLLFFILQKHMDVCKNIVFNFKKQMIILKNRKKNVFYPTKM